MNVDYAAVLTGHPDYAGRLWGMTDNDYSTLVMHDGGSKPTKSALESRSPDVARQAEIDAVRDERARLYRQETDGLFFEAQRGEGSVTLDDWKAAVQEIKEAHPWPA
jgi:hypothetical protein